MGGGDVAQPVLAVDDTQSYPAPAQISATGALPSCRNTPLVLRPFFSARFKLFGRNKIFSFLESTRER